MIAEFSEHNNTPRNPRKHRRLDDDPPDTGDPRGPSPPPHPGQSAPTNPVSPTIRINLLGALASEEEEAIDEDEIEILEGDVNSRFSLIFYEWDRLQFSETMEPTRLPEFAAKGKSVVPKPSKVSELSKPVINVRKTLSVSRNMPTSRFANSASSSSTLPYVPPLSKPIDRGNHSDKNSQSLPPGEPPDVQGVQGARTTLDGIDLSLQGRSTIPSNLIIASASILDMSVDVAVVNVTS
ncbi:hypothetical protein V6N13_020244 [Hibiscus sabdariffa]